MEELKLRGYVTPEDFDGTDTEKIQKAIDTAAEEDIRKVIIEKDYEVTETVKIPAGMEIKLTKGVTVKAAGCTLFENAVLGDDSKASYSFEDQWIYLLGAENSKFVGDVKFFHAGNIIIEDVVLDGSLTFEFCREIRMERDTINAPENAVTIMRGSNNYIMQYNTFNAKNCALIADTALKEGPYVIGKDEDIHELIVRENTFNAETAFFVGSTPDSKVFNVQYDHTKVTGKGIVIGREGETLEKTQYFNLTATDFTGATAEVVKNNETMHCYFGN